MTILTDSTGALLIGTQDCPAESAGFSAWNPATGAALTPTFGNASPAQVAQACTLSFTFAETGQRAARHAIASSCCW